MHVIPLSFSRFGTVSASSATPTSSSTYPLKVSFIVLVFKNRVMIGGGGGSNSGTQSEWKSMLGHNLRDSSNQHCSQTYTFTEREPWCPAPHLLHHSACLERNPTVKRRTPPSTASSSLVAVQPLSLAVWLLVLQ